ncbi:hypothetical protein ACRRTK_022326 [Alexandromys fortis]
MRSQELLHLISNKILTDTSPPEPEGVSKSRTLMRVPSLLLAAAVLMVQSSLGTVGRDSPRDFVVHFKGLCYYTNGTQHVRLVTRYIYNQEEYVRFDSDVGKYIAVTELGRPDAEYWNSQKEILEQTQAETDTVCRHNYEEVEAITSLRRLGERRAGPQEAAALGGSGQSGHRSQSSQLKKLSPSFLTFALCSVRPMLPSDSGSAESPASRTPVSADSGKLNEQPKVTVYLSRTEVLNHHNTLACSVTDFYPAQIKVRWFRNGQEETAGVVSTKLIQNGDWTYQVLVMLEMTPQRGDVYTCHVEHPSLQSPVTVDWSAQSESAQSKMLSGIGGFVMGLIFLGLGLFVRYRSQKGEDSGNTGVVGYAQGRS